MDSQYLKDLLWNLEEDGQTSSAIRMASKLSVSHPKELYFKLRQHLALPVIYETKEEIDWYRNQFTRGLDEIVRVTSLSTPEAINNAVESLQPNFYLGHQGYDDLELQKKYGDFVHRIMAAKYPQWVEPLPMPPLTQDGKIRVGYVSGFLKSHVIAKWTLGWIKYSNKQQFEIYCYHVGKKTDSITEEYRINSNVFHHIHEGVEAACQQIIADKLHVLVFTDIGMLPKITKMAGLRLAPVQCTSMGHPITSGSPTIDYFLSSELMEAENADSHYSEQLIRLPNMGVSFAYPTIPAVSGNRADINLADDAVVYLSIQRLFKYLPQYDYIFAAIALRVPKAKIVFRSQSSDLVIEQFRRRLQRAFANVGLNSEEYCAIVPGEDWTGYCNLNKVSDIFLDTFTWCGCTTTLEAIAFNLPVVICPGEFLRQRKSYGILKMLGVTETIAKDIDEYIEIAVRLGKDREWRSSIVEKISQRHEYLYDDKTCVAALEDFYQSVVRGNYL